MKKAIIWGANGGIGKALAADLASRNWDVLAVSRNGGEVDGARISLQADVANERAVEAAVMEAAYEASDIDLFIYAAGDIHSARVEEATPADWKRIVDANLTGAFLTTHYSLPLLADDAHLVFLGAVSERLRLPGLAAYAAAKAGLEAFADTLRKEQRSKRVLVVRPGAVDTPFWDKVPMRLPKDAPSAQKVSGRIVDACEAGETGSLDLT